MAKNEKENIETLDKDEDFLGGYTNKLYQKNLVFELVKLVYPHTRTPITTAQTVDKLFEYINQKIDSINKQ